MSDKILRALMQLFAIVSNGERLTAHGRNIVELFLKQQLSASYVQTYLEIFDDYLKFLQGKSDPGNIKKRVSVNSVKVLRICADINAELDQKQKYIVLIRLIEFAYSSSEAITEQEADFLSAVVSSFNISAEEYDACLSIAIAGSSTDVKDSSFLQLMNNKVNLNQSLAKHVFNEALDGDLWILNVKSAGIMFVRYFGNNQLTLNGQPLLNASIYVFTQGSVIRGVKLQPVYYSDVIRRFLENTRPTTINLTVKKIEYQFNSGRKGIHTISFSASSGNLIGIMGGSGAGKSTLLNILNSNLTPSNGEVLINGINIHKEGKRLEGVIGFVPQDDLLMEDLTVFQNLFYNSKLCFDDLNDEEIKNKVNRLMGTLGLFEVKDLKVGGSLDKTISGGQRKRLNIALELIREPEVLFVDEPTSGLSSRDSENVMDLLKQLSINGKLILVVIHQPSSDIFKLFDKLLILDTGGYPIYFNNPSDSLIYFKHLANYAADDEGECATCGNINPEQVFSIIESKVLDEFGNQTNMRKISPIEWNNFYTANSHLELGDEINIKEISDSHFKKPSWIKQFGVFIRRDVLSKLRNTQYLLINLLEAPALAFILSFFLKYHSPGTDYVFSKNTNLPAYIFMSVIVALFIGLTVSAEEIIRDRKILKREAFLNLSRSSYLLSKISIMFFISAIQTFTFVLIGNSVFEIKDMFLEYWLVLFSISSFANLIGLNISSAFDSVVTIYILIPFLIIPQIILSGVMVKFENLNASITCQDRVPVIGEIMASRWAFEALAINQFKNNRYEKLFFESEKTISASDYKKDFWLQAMDDSLESLHNKYNSLKNDKSLINTFTLIRSELEKENIANPEIKFNAVDKLQYSSFDESQYKNLKTYFVGIKKYYTHQNNSAREKKDSIINTLSQSANKLSSLEGNYTNESLNDLVLDKNNLHPIVEYNTKLVRHYQPIYMDGSFNSFIRAQFFAPRKHAFYKYYNTFPINNIIICLMTMVAAVVLYFDWLRKILKVTSNFVEKIKLNVRKEQ